FGASDVASHEIADSPGKGSVTTTGSSVTLPLFTTMYVYVINVPAAENSAMLGSLTIAIAGACTSGTFSSSVSTTDVPSGAVPVAVPTFATKPRSTSACVVV